MALKTKKLTSLMPKGSSPVNSLTSSSTTNTTKTYGRSLTNASGFSRRSQNLKSTKQLSDKSNTISNKSVSIPVPTTSIFSADMEESQDSSNQNDDLVIIDRSETPSSNNNVDKVRSVKKLLLISEGDQEDVITDSSIQITIKDEIVCIRSTEGLFISIPFEKVKQFKLANKDAFCNVIMFVMSPTPKRIKHIVKKVEMVVLYLTNPLSLKEAAQIAKTLNVKLRKFTLSETSRFSPLAFEPIPAARFTGNGPNTSTLTKITNQMDTDFSSLERKIRRNNTRGKVTYEELNDNEINEIMLGENGSSRIYGYIPDNEQLYFEPTLKVKFDNKKTFSITNNEFKCLYNDNWINDTIIDFVTAHLLYTAREKNIPKSQNIEIFNSFFFTSLSRPVEDSNYYKNVKSWFKRVDDLFDKDYIIIPINQDLHWYFVVISGLKQLKRRYLKKKEMSVDDTKNTDSETNVDETKKDITLEARDKIESEVDFSSNNTQKEVSKVVADKSDTNVNGVCLKNEELIGVNIHGNSGDIIPVKSPVKNKRKLIDDETGDLKADNRPPGAAQISVLNSLRKNHDKAILLLKHFLISYAKDKYDLDLNPQDIFKKICLVPQQKNLNDCGIHVLFNIQTMLQNPTEFDRTILKRPTGNKIRNQAKYENEKFFDKNRLLNYREELRNLLFELLRKQVEDNSGDSSNVGIKTVGQKLIEGTSRLDMNELKNTKIDNKAENSNNNQKHEEKADDSDDDLVITHFHEKNPLVDNGSNGTKTKDRRLKISVMDSEFEQKDDIDMMASDSDYQLHKKYTKQRGSRKLNVRKPRVSDYNVASSSSPSLSLSPSPLIDNSKLFVSKKAGSSNALENPREKSSSHLTLDSDNDAGRDNEAGICNESVLRIPLTKARRRPKSTELLSQDSFNGEDDGVKLLESDEDHVDVIDENQHVPQDTIPREITLDSRGSELSNIQSGNSAELLMKDIDKEIMSQESDNSAMSKQDKEISLGPGLRRRYRDSTIARITGTKQSIPIEINDDVDNRVVDISGCSESSNVSSDNEGKNSENIELLKSASPESESDSKKDACENGILDLSKTYAVDVDTRQPVSKEKSSLKSAKLKTENHNESNLPIKISSIRILKKVEPLEKKNEGAIDTNKTKLVGTNTIMKKEPPITKPNCELRNEISSYLSKSYNSSPIKLQSESPLKETGSCKNLGTELFAMSKPTKRKLKADTSKTPSNEVIKIEESTGESVLKLDDDKPLTKETNVSLPLYATRRQSPREDLKPISASLFSKSKSKPKSKSKLKSKATTGAYIDSTPTILQLGDTADFQNFQSAEQKKNNESIRESRSASSEKIYQTQKRNRSQDINSESEEIRIAPRKKTRSNYRVSDTELKNSLYNDKYCGNVYNDRKSTKGKLRGSQAQDVYTALRSNDDYTVKFTNVPPSFGNDDYIMENSDVEIVKTDDEDSFNPSKLSEDESYGRIFTNDLDNSIKRRSKVSKQSVRKFRNGY